MTVINGPEIMSKFYGETEVRLRQIVTEALKGNLRSFSSMSWMLSQTRGDSERGGETCCGLPPHSYGWDWFRGPLRPSAGPRGHQPAPRPGPSPLSAWTLREGAGGGRTKHGGASRYRTEAADLCAL
ncbi:hypothetical protein J4Q44_G00305160 [Coregonus suidteri]|uniref:Uncharacterized protein n=1 Tax=Coregonus suidteri TaxID=861788 RepID=A0AAN8L4K0_9TELE